MNRSLIVASVAAVLALPATAGASTVTGTPDPTNPAWSNAVFAGGNGVNDVTLTGSTVLGFTWADAAQTLKAKGTCVAGAPVVCPIGDADVQLGSGDDTLTNSFYSLFVSVEGGSGNDTITANGNGTTVSGGSGQDTIDVKANGAAVAHGDADADALRGGHPSNWGAKLWGDGGSDLVVGNAHGDELEGGSGNDQIFTAFGESGFAHGGPGADVIVDLGVIGGAFTSHGDSGNDIIIGATTAADAVDGGANADRIDVSGGGPDDTVACGPGFDVVWADAGDTIAADCEVVRAGPAPAFGDVAAAVAHLRATYPTTPTGSY